MVDPVSGWFESMSYWFEKMTCWFEKMISVNTPSLEAPSLAALRTAVARFGAASGRPFEGAESFDGADPQHCRTLLNWLNKWGCRIRTPRDGEEDIFAIGMAQWWDKYGTELPGPHTGLAGLTDAEIDSAGECFGDLMVVAAGDPVRPRTLGSTAAAKTLYAFRPRALMPWDDAIASKLHGARDGKAYAAHQRLGRAWAADLLKNTGLSERQLAAALGDPERSLAKIFDDYCYLRFTRMEQL